jgi:diadenosine tetraphosphate (Ap4A) HIT family hydrolase
LRRGGRPAKDLAMAFTLHPRLAAGGFDFGTHRGCRVLLKNNALFPWFIVVPEVDEGIEDLHQLEPQRFHEVAEFIREVSCFVTSHFGPDKLNVACIGNQVRQMHIHVVGRSPGDPAWPGVVWSFEGKETYANDAVEEIRGAFERWLAAK